MVRAGVCRVLDSLNDTSSERRYAPPGQGRGSIVSVIVDFAVSAPATSAALFSCLGLFMFSACRSDPVPASAGGTANPVMFSDDVRFLKAHTETIVLSDGAGRARVAVAPAWQGRVLTSTARGMSGLSFGWINRDLIASGAREPHINAFGGEDRFWLGPEGGQFGLYFRPGDPFDFDHWQVPPALDTEAFQIERLETDRAAFRKALSLVNHSGASFHLDVHRMVRVLPGAEALHALMQDEGLNVDLVAYESINRVANIGEEAWTKETGLLSIWILGMYNPSPATTIVLPFMPGPEDQLGPVVNDVYFGPVPSGRLIVRDGVLFFRGDGLYRSKIGLSPRRARSVLGSFDTRNEALTIVQYAPFHGGGPYVNSMWEIQDDPYGGDVVNSYNDGPPAPGAEPLGPFYELETSSPAAALRPGESITHIHRTFHVQGDRPAMNRIARDVLGIGLDGIEAAFSKSN